ncbi:MAG: 16S rRNA methyltransferase [Chloroflexaceae bacterium]|nr:16S rRNA methyltransferase [Chloroflexaceae bacterium]
MAGAYLDSRPPYDAWFATLAAAQAEGPEQFRAACRTMLNQHASTRERLPVLETFYTTLFAALPPVRSVLDVACGLNPLAWPWMGLPAEVNYSACDLYSDMATFLNQCFGLLGVAGVAEARDVIAAPPPQQADVAFVFKTLPVLEQVRRDAGRDLLRALNAEHMLVSFPTASLGGRNRHMASNYATQFIALVETEGWQATRFDFASELVFLVRK